MNILILIQRLLPDIPCAETEFCALSKLIDQYLILKGRKTKFGVIEISLREHKLNSMLFKKMKKCGRILNKIT